MNKFNKKIELINSIVKLFFLVCSVALATEVNAETERKNCGKLPQICELGNIGPGGGIVYYIDPVVGHSLEAQPQDEPGFFDWYQAKKIVENHALGWRLPTRKELEVLYLNKDIVGGFKDGDYWSSSKHSVRSAWYQSFSNNIQDANGTQKKLRVRAIRNF